MARVAPLSNCLLLKYGQGSSSSNWQQAEQHYHHQWRSLDLAMTAIGIEFGGQSQSHSQALSEPESLKLFQWPPN